MLKSTLLTVRLFMSASSSYNRRSTDRSRRSYDRRSSGRDHYDGGGGGGGGSRYRDDGDDLPPSEYDLLTEEERLEEASKINEGKIESLGICFTIRPSEFVYLYFVASSLFR